MARQYFPEISILVGTVPPLGEPYADPGCSAVLQTLNARIKTMGEEFAVPVIDFHGVLQEADIMTEGAPTLGLFPDQKATRRCTVYMFRP
jgi:hypothetical protein